MIKTAKSFSKQGFTLIEIMVAMSIVAVLAVVGLVLYSTINATTRDSKRTQDMAAIQSALEQHFAANRNYPNGTDIYSNPGNINAAFSTGLPPTDPTGATYNFYGANCPTGGWKYIVCAKMESCTGARCNRSSLPQPAAGRPAEEAACDTITSTTPAITTANGRYCVGARSN